MTVKREPLPINRKGNGSNIQTIEFDIADAPMLASAIAIGRNTVLMSSEGKNKYNAIGRMNYYLQKLLDVCPPGHKHLRGSEELCNIIIEMAMSESWSIWQKKRWLSSSEGKTCIKIGEQYWETYIITDEDHAELKACLHSLAPVECEGKEEATVIENQ